MEKNWIKKGTQFTPVSGQFTVVPTIESGIYNLVLDLQGWHLEKYQDKFEFPFKIYGLQTNLINHIIKTYNNSSENLGILFTGTKGSGKTICAKRLSNELGLPVIIVKSFGGENQSMIEFLGSLNCDCVLFFDEFEKQFDENDNTILQIMDGVYNNIESRKIFILTTNNLFINENLLSRPSRIRYVKMFSNTLDLDVVKEYLVDNLKDCNDIEDLLNYINTLEISTIDILKTIVQEVNIHGFSEFYKERAWFNVAALGCEYLCWSGYIETSTVKNTLEDSNLKSLTEVFLQDIDRKSFNYDDSGIDFDSLTDDEIKKSRAEYRKKNRIYFYDVKRLIIKSKDKFSKLRVGDMFSGEGIISINKDLHIVVTFDESNGYLTYYKILNPNYTPSRLENESGIDYSKTLDISL